MKKGFKYHHQEAVGTRALLCSANHQQEPEAKLARFVQEDPKESTRKMLKRLWEEIIHGYKKDVAYELSSL